jgi:hypothetical protein
VPKLENDLILLAYGDVHDIRRCIQIDQEPFFSPSIMGCLSGKDRQSSLCAGTPEFTSFCLLRA